MNRNKVISAGVAVLAIAGAAYACLNWWPAHQAQSAVKARLNDPDSAQFAGMRHFIKTGATCGAVNAKNMMGGYTGLRRFTFTKDAELQFFPAPALPSDTTEEQMEAIRKQINYLKFSLEHCPEK